MKMTKQMKKINEWFYNLNEDDKLDVIEGVYPNEVGLIDSDELWERTDWKVKWEVYNDNDNEPTEEKLEAQRTDAAERETHRHQVEGEIE